MPTEQTTMLEDEFPTVDSAGQEVLTIL